MQVTFTECDTEGGSYTPVADKLVVPGKTTDDTGAVTIEADPAGSELHNIDIDLVGCKQFIKATVAWSAPVNLPELHRHLRHRPRQTRTCSRCKEGDGYVQSV